MDPFIGQIMPILHSESTTSNDSRQSGWIIIDSMSSPIYRSIGEN